VRVLTRAEADKRAFVRLVLCVTAIGCLLKGVIFVYSLKSGVSVSDIMDRVSLLFGVKLMTADLGDTSVRLQFTSDNLLPACLFALLCLRKKLRIGAVAGVVMMVLLLMSALYTFSRYLWATAAVAVVLGIVVAKRDRLHWLYLGVSGAATAIFFPVISTLVAFRFSNELVESSDVVRVDQVRALQAFFWDAPWFGHGLGSYTTDVIRSVDVPYNYEVQLLALAGQVGLVGMAVFLVLLVNYYRKAFSFGPGGWGYQFSVLTLLGCFIVAALFNPTLLSSMSAAIFGFLYVLAGLGHCQGEAVEEPVSARPARFVMLRSN
jgi:O-antigen ligase